MSGQDAQSESLKALICISESIAKNNPLIRLALTYRRAFQAAC